MRIKAEIKETAPARPGMGFPVSALMAVSIKQNHLSIYQGKANTQHKLL